jgi:hypothetical protein
MLILEEDRAEIAILQDGRNFAVHEFVAKANEDHDCCKWMFFKELTIFGIYVTQ